MTEILTPHEQRMLSLIDKYFNKEQLTTLTGLKYTIYVLKIEKDIEFIHAVDRLNTHKTFHLRIHDKVNFTEAEALLIVGEIAKPSNPKIIKFNQNIPDQ